MEKSSVKASAGTLFLCPPQFFVTLQDVVIDDYTAIGKIVHGFEILESLKDVIVDDNDHPVEGEDVVITRGGELELKKSNRKKTSAQQVQVTDSSEKTYSTEENFSNNKKPSQASTNMDNSRDIDSLIKGSIQEPSPVEDNSINVERRNMIAKESLDVQKINSTKPGHHRSKDYRNSMHRYRDTYDQDDDKRRYSRNYHSSRSYREPRYGYDKYENKRHRNRNDQRETRYEETSERLSKIEESKESKIIFKGRGNMKLKEKEFGRL